MSDQWEACFECALRDRSETRSRGSATPEVLIVGDAPSRDDDRAGRVFSGPLGEALDSYIHASGLDGKCRLTNLVRCFPYDAHGQERKPLPEEIGDCHAQLLKEIVDTQPKVIIALGSVVHEFLIGVGVVKLARGESDATFPGSLPRTAKKQVVNDEWFEWLVEQVPEPIPVVCTYDPASALPGRSTKFGPVILSDFHRVAELLSGEVRRVDYAPIQDPLDFVEYIDYVVAGYLDGTIPFITIDVEQTGSDHRTTKMTGFSITHKPGQGRFIPWDHKHSEVYGDQHWKDTVCNVLNEALETVPVANQNMSFDYQALYARGIFVKHIYGDPMLASWWIDGDTTPHGLEDLAAIHLKIHGHKSEFEKEKARVGGWEHIDEADFDMTVRYCCADTDTAWQLVSKLQARIVKQGTWDAYRVAMLDAIIPIAHVEMDGVVVNKPRLEASALNYERVLAEFFEWFNATPIKELYETELVRQNPKKAKDPSLSPESWKDIAILLYDVLGLTPHKDCITIDKVTGEITSRKVSLKFRDGYILECTELISLGLNVEWWTLAREFLTRYNAYLKDKKIYGTYVKPLPGCVSSDGRIHTNFGIGCTASGRYNSFEPSLHTMPWRSTVKEAFEPADPLGLILNVDFKQAEMFMLAFLSQEPVLLKALTSGADIHRTMAARLYQKAFEDVSDAERRHNKTVVFGLVYGRSAHAIAIANQIPLQQAEALMERFFQEFPGIRKFIKAQQKLVQHKGIVKIPVIDRIRPVPGALSTDRGERSKADRIAVNTPIQGAASGVAAEALIRIWHGLRLAETKSHLWNFTHDSGTGDIYPDELLQVAKLFYREMVMIPPTLYPLVTVPMRIDYELGVNWGQLVNAKFDFVNLRMDLSGAADKVEPILVVLECWDSFDRIEDYVAEEGSIDGEPTEIASCSVYFNSF